MASIVALLVLFLGPEPYAWLADGWRWSGIVDEAGEPLPPVRDLAVVPGGAFLATADGLFVWDGFTARRFGPSEGWDVVAVDALDLTRCAIVRKVAGRHEPLLVERGRTVAFGPSESGELPTAAALASGGAWVLAEREGGCVLWRTGADGRVLSEPLVLEGAAWGRTRFERTAAGRVFVLRVGQVFEIGERGVDPAWPSPDRFAVWKELRQAVGGPVWGVLVYPPEHAGLYTIAAGGRPEAVSAPGWPRIRALAPLPEGGALAVGVDGSVLWIEPAGGVHRWATPPPGLVGADLLTFDGGGDLWVAGEQGAFLVRRRTEPLARLEEAGTDGDERVVHAIAADGDGWLVATVGGVARFGAGERWERLPPLPGVDQPIVTSAVRDRSGRVWAASGGGFDGVFVLEGGSWRRVLRDVHGHPLGLVHRIRRTGSARGGERLYFAALAPGRDDPFADEGGIFVLEESGPRRLATKRKLVGARIYDLAQEGDVRLLATSRGLFVWREGQEPRCIRPGRFRVALALRGGGFAAGGSRRLVLLDEAGRAVAESRARGGDVADIFDEGDGRVVVLAGRSLHWFDGTSEVRSFTLPAAFEPWTSVVREAPCRYLVGSAGGGLFRLDLAGLRDERLGWRLFEAEARRGTWSARVEGALRKDRWPSSDLFVRWRIDDGEWSPWVAGGEPIGGRLPAGRHRLTVQARHPVTGAPGPATSVVLETPTAAWRRPDVLAAVGALAAVSVLLFFWAWSQRRRARLALEVRRRHAERAEHLEAIGRLAAGVAHDFNNVLQALLGTLEMARAELAKEDGDPRRALADLDDALAAARRSIDLTARLLAIARPREGHVRRVDFTRRVREVASLLARLAGERVRIEVEAQGEVPVRADPTYLDRIVLNLALNAIEAVRPEGGTVRLAVRADGVSGRLEVSDDGPGVPRGLWERVFEPFFTTKRGAAERPGVGLGLANVRELVDACRGSIRLEESREGGARFVVELPIDRRSAA